MSSGLSWTRRKGRHAVGFSSKHWRTTSNAKGHHKGQMGITVCPLKLRGDDSFWDFLYLPKCATFEFVQEAGKRCKYCGGLYPEDAFGVALTTPTKVYRRRKCRDCYRGTKKALIARHYEWLCDYKHKKGCYRCGVKDPRVLDFHHRNKEDKLFGIGGFRREIGFQRLSDEIEKCEVVCANCHRILHDEDRKNGA